MGHTRRRHETYCTECEKTAHLDHESAHKARRSLIESAKHRTKPGVLRVYPRPHGNGWHIGHCSNR